MIRTISELIQEQAGRTPHATAITAPGGTPTITYRWLAEQIPAARAELNRFGLGRNDRVAVVMDNGPAMAAAFVIVSASATFAPVDPACQAREFELTFERLGAKALIVEAGSQATATRAAEDTGIPAIELICDAEGPSMRFEPRTGSPAGDVREGPAEARDAALILQTSGTTSKPKVVPLTQENLCASAGTIVDTLGLEPADRCLNIMPLFHIHGLVAAVLASMAAGSQVICTPGLDPRRFKEWVQSCRPTWYTAVPTMHQAILSLARGDAALAANRTLRFIRSSSATLPEKVRLELEQVFETPVIEAYGMTEASHQMTSNPLPPRPRKPRSVGLATGIDVAIMDEYGRLLAQGETGEVVIRGPSVTGGYENDPQANQAAFTGSWFRTGDQGYLDCDGYLFLAGRLKEIINRGGENILPREIDEALLDHEAVNQAVAFPMPDEKLGEEVAAAVVLEAGSSATEDELRKFVGRRLAHFKVPRRIAILEAIPKGPSGKLQRIGLAERLGLPREQPTREGSRTVVPARTELERELARIWSTVLEVETVGVTEDFVELGGDSILAAALFAEVDARFGRKLSMASLFEAPTVEQQARLLEGERSSRPARSMVTLRSDGSGPPLFLVHPLTGSVQGFYGLVRHLDGGYPVYAFQARGIDGEQQPLTRVEQMAELYLDELKEVQENGPYYLAGHSFGCLIGFEMARRLRAAGEEVAFLGLIHMPVTESPVRDDSRTLSGAVRRVFREIDYRIQLLRLHDMRGRWDYLMRGLRRQLSRSPVPPVDQRVFEAHRRAKSDYTLHAYPGSATLFRGSVELPNVREEPDLGWRRYVGDLRIEPVLGCHLTVVERYPGPLAEKVGRCLQEARVRATRPKVPGDRNISA